MQAPISLDNIPKKSLQDARSLIAQELEVVMTEKIAGVMQAGKAQTESRATDVLFEQTAAATAAGTDGGAAFNGQTWTEKASRNDKIKSMKKEVEILEEATAALRQKNQKIESKLGVLNGGFIKRAESLATEAKAVHDDRLNAVIEESVYKQLFDNEQMGGNQRLQTLRQEIQDIQEDAYDLHAKYEELKKPGQGKAMEIEA
uniref:Uncharacterized protein n=1 Tax=Craspedostauros australis TaxID=1486917 RepID=A0A7R9WS87_9STRA